MSDSDLDPTGLNLHIEAEFYFCIFFHPPNAFGIPNSGYSHIVTLNVL